MIKVTFEKAYQWKWKNEAIMRKLKITTKLLRTWKNEDLCIIYMNRVGGFLLQRQDMVIAYAHVHKTAIW